MRNYDAYSEDLRIEVKESIMTLTLHNPENLNANTPAMHTALSKIWDDIQDDTDVNVVIFTGAGRAFSAGGNPHQMQELIDDDEKWWPLVPEAKRIIFRMLECDKPIIAKLNGHAVGFGATLALASDIIVAVETARIGDPHVNAGFACGDGGALLWPQAVGYARAKEFLFTGNLLTAVEAAQIGLINYALPADEVDAKVNELAQQIARGAGRAIRFTKNVMNIPLRQLAHSTLDLGMANETLTKYSEDHQAAVRAFIEKKTPRFKGR